MAPILQAVEKVAILARLAVLRADGRLVPRSIVRALGKVIRTPGQVSDIVRRRRQENRICG